MHLHRIESVGVHHEVEGSSTHLIGESLQQEVLDPDAGMIELRLMTGHEDRSGFLVHVAHRNAEPR
jgi:hypothetical protein